MKNSVHIKPQVIACQRGARHRYVIPRLLEEEEMLAAFYTDSTRHSFAGKVAVRLDRLGVGPSQMHALASRVLPGVPLQKIHSSDRPLYAALSGGRLSRDLGPTYIRWGLRGADVVYNMYGEDLSFLQWAKEKGAKIIVDVFVHPGTTRIVAEESVQIFGRDEGGFATAKVQDQHSQQTFELADILLCPSQWVADGVCSMFPESGHKVRVIPYGSSLEIHSSINRTPKSGRVLFAGRDPLRKGLHYLAAAAHGARTHGVELDVRVAGVDVAEVDWIEHKDELHCLGTLPMSQMHQEFTQADVLVCPSLSEGQAGVILEAMACGCPVISTKESGVDFNPGCGITVPSRDAEALAHAILDVVGDPAKRNRLAEGALRQADEFSMKAWRQRLAEAVMELVE